MHRWFHPNLNNLEAERLLLERGQDGSFLVRPSRSCAGHFSLSVRRRDKVTHIKIRHSGDFFDLHGGEQFATLAELIQHYTENGLREKNGEIYELKRPLNSSDPTTERWFHGSISGITAERLIREKGVNGSFLVRESQSKIGDYVLTVRTKDETSQADKITHVMIRHKNNQYDVGGGERFDSLTELVEHYKRNPMVETTGIVVNMKYPFNATRIAASDIEARVKELSKDNPQINGKEGFWEEFEHLQHQECKVLFNRKIGQEDKNMLKNRYKNILPYDYTRVILKKPQIYGGSSSSGGRYNNHTGQGSSNGSTNSGSSNGTIMANEDNEYNHSDDYINANYVKLVEDDTGISPSTKPVPHSKIYIATQGPLPNTIVDFWWMVWQERSECIAMVTKEVERGKNKCCRYWPTLEQPVMCCGPLEVRLLFDSAAQQIQNHLVANANGPELRYARRGLELRYIGNGGSGDDNMSEIRRVVQHQFYAWPDLNIPADSEGVLEFLREINRGKPEGPIIVHCSAGIGRSGTLIVIDMLIDQLSCYGLSYEIDIQKIVKVVRAQRSGLVQTEAQYKFIYLTIRDYVSDVTCLRDRK